MRKGNFVLLTSIDSSADSGSFAFGMGNPVRGSSAGSEGPPGAPGGPPPPEEPDALYTLGGGFIGGPAGESGMT